jgi:hypothetical protein
MRRDVNLTAVMRLFISHASEDKKDFVRPLAERLREFFDVWFDEYELTLGDRLLAKINEGLNSCDFGVVVLSPAFFGKKWPQAELDGLFALEEPTKKIILPIWKDVTERDVKEYSPILALRYAALASAGVENVVEKIRIAVETSERKRELTTLDSASKRLRGLDQTLKERQDSNVLLSSGEGPGLVFAAAQNLFQCIETVLSRFSKSSSVLKFTFRRPDRLTFAVETVYRLNLHCSIRRLADNSAASAILTIAVFGDLDRFEQEVEILWKEELSPSFRRGKQVVWKTQGTDRTLSNEELADHAIEKLEVELTRRGLGTDHSQPR